VFFSVIINIYTEERSHTAHKKHMKHHRFYRKQNGTNSSDAAGNSTGNDTGPIILNSVGRKIYVTNSSLIVLTQFPFQITRCDQIVSFNASFIPDLTEYRSRASGNFTLTAHYANLFQTAPSLLLRSILMSESKIEPRILEGTGNCIMIFSNSGPSGNIPICLDDPTQLANILDVLRIFSECRGGNSIGTDSASSKPIDLLKVADMVKTCGGKGKFVNPFSLIKRLNNLKDIPVRKNKDWYHPGSDNVPGTGLRRR